MTPRDRLRWQLPILLFVVAGVLQVAVVWLRAGHAFYFSDDFLNFEFFRSEGFGKRYLLHDAFGQLIPGYRAVQALMLTAFGLNYFPAFVIICALTVGYLVVVIAIGLRLGAPLPLVVAITLLLICQLHLTNAQVWWSASLCTLPGLLAVVLGLWFLVGRDGEPGDTGTAAAACFGIGLLFFSKVLFAGALYFGTLLFLRQRGQPIAALCRNALATIWQLRFVIAVGIGWSLVVYRFTNGLGGPKPPFGMVADTIWKSVSDGTSAALLGLGSHGALLFGSDALTAALSLLVLAAVVIATFRVAGASAAILWASYGAYLVAAMGVIAMTRALVFGSDVGRSLRYNIENANFLLLILLVAFASRSSSRRPLSAASRWAVAAAIAVPLAINLQIQSAKIPDPWDVATVRRYVDTLSRSVTEISRNKQVVILDEPAPEKIVPAWMAPLNQYRYFLPLFPSAPPVAASDQATHRITPEGEIVVR